MTSADNRPVIMAIDDDPVILNLSVGILRKSYRLRPFTSGKMALKYLSLPGAEVDLVLLDYQMPEMNGQEVLAKLRADSATRDRPIIFMTGQDNVDQEVGCPQDDLIDFISKPPIAADLLATIDRHLKSRTMPN